MLVGLLLLTLSIVCFNLVLCVVCRLVVRSVGVML